MIKITGFGFYNFSNLFLKQKVVVYVKIQPLFKAKNVMYVKTQHLLH